MLETDIFIIVDIIGLMLGFMLERYEDVPEPENRESCEGRGVGHL